VEKVLAELHKAQQEIKDICLPLKEQLNLEYFSYGRFHKSGKCELLTTNAKVFENHFKKKYQLTLKPSKEQLKQPEIYNLITIEPYSPPIIQDEHKYFGHGTMVNIIRIHADGYETFCFVSNKTDTEQVNIFYRNLTHMKFFCNIFLSNTAKHRQSCSFTLPPEMMTDISGEQQYSPHSIIHNYKTHNLTKRQFQCLTLLTKGKYCKEIAYILGISESTVKDHLSQTKISLHLYENTSLRETGLINNLHMIPNSLLLI